MRWRPLPAISSVEVSSFDRVLEPAIYGTMSTCVMVYVRVLGQIVHGGTNCYANPCSVCGSIDFHRKYLLKDAPLVHLLLKFRPMGTAVEEARSLNAECKPQLVHPTPGTQVSELPVSNRIFRNGKLWAIQHKQKFPSVLRIRCNKL